MVRVAEIRVLSGSLDLQKVFLGEADHAGRLRAEGHVDGVENSLVHRG